MCFFVCSRHLQTKEELVQRVMQLTQVADAHQSLEAQHESLNFTHVALQEAHTMLTNSYRATRVELEQLKGMVEQERGANFQPERGKVFFCILFLWHSFFFTTGEF